MTRPDDDDTSEDSPPNNSNVTPQDCEEDAIVYGDVVTKKSHEPLIASYDLDPMTGFSTGTLLRAGTNSRRCATLQDGLP
jgi:hypothetical protein